MAKILDFQKRMQEFEAKYRDFSGIEPADLWNVSIKTPLLTRGILPDVLEDFAFSREGTQDPLALAMCALTACAVTVQGTFSVRVTSDWYEAPVLWLVLLGPPATLKSPILKRAMRPIIDIQKTTMANISDVKGQPKVPPPIRLYTSDSTLEALTELLRLHDHGILLFQDELSTFLSNFMEGGRDLNNSGAWLTGHVGGTFMVDRITRKNVYVKNFLVSILGAATTDKIMRLAKRIPADGLLPRFTPVLMTQPGKGLLKDVEDGEYHGLVNQLYKLRDRPHQYLHLSPKAAKAFAKYRAGYIQRAELHQESLPRLSETENKYPGLLLRIACLFHVIKHPQGAPPKILVQTLQRAAQLVDLLALHALAFYNTLKGHQEGMEMVVARAIGDYLLRMKKEEFQLGDLTRHVIEWREAKVDVQLQAMQILWDVGWVQPDREDFFVRNFIKGVKWAVNPVVHERYKQRAEAVRELAQEAVEAIRKSAETRRIQLRK